MESKVILALGNPGTKYRHTRHNAGRIALEAILAAQPHRSCSWEKRQRLFSELCLSPQDENRVIYARTLVFMNESGKAAAALLHHYRICSKRILVLQDDSDLEFGKLKSTEDSRSAGHHGIESIIESIGSTAFARIRIGVRPRGNTAKADDLVLKPFTKTEITQLEKTIAPQVQALIASWLTAR